MADAVLAIGRAGRLALLLAEQFSCNLPGKVLP